MAELWLAVLLMSTALPAGAAVLVSMTPAEPLTAGRIASLPERDRAAWSAYLSRSHRSMELDRAALAAERGGSAVPAPPPAARTNGMPLDHPGAWYATREARAVADTIVSFQTPAGGWGKNVDRAGPVRARGQSYVEVENLPSNAREPRQSAASERKYVGTIDNDATTTEIRFLARVQAQVAGRDSDPYRAALFGGIRYLLAAQYPNGGWPQIYPLQGGYHDAVTFNDNAIAHVVGVLAQVEGRTGDYAIVPAALAAQAAAARARAIAVIFRSQVAVGGKRTIWSQQVDALTLAPVGARNFEPAALSTDESASLLLLLMQQPDPSPALADAIRSGVTWLTAHAIHDRVWPRSPPDPQGRRLVALPGAGPIWARYHDPASGRPVFGDRDKSIHDDVNELSLERRNGYSWFGTAPAKAITIFERWAAAHPASRGIAASCLAKTADE